MQRSSNSFIFRSNNIYSINTKNDLMSLNQEELRKIEQAYLEETGRELTKDIDKIFLGIMKKIY